VNGRICGFGGRQLTKDDKSPKYLNSAETILYKKSHILYALNLAKDRVHETGYAILCEGYMDVVMAHAYGFDQAVASLGTALTREQARLLKRFANKTYFLYDGDSAGQKAMLRGGEPLLESGFDVRVLPLPAEDDPDTFLRREGADALKAKLNEADEFFDFALKSHSQTLDLQSLAGQAELVERLSPILVAMRNDVMREGAILRLLKRLGGLPREAINQILDRKKKDAARRSGESREGLPEEAAQTPEIRGAPPLDSLERNLLKVMLESSDALNMIRMHLHFDWIADDRLADWIFFLNDHHEYVQTLLDDVEVSGDYPGDQRILTSIMAWDHPLGDPVETAGELLRRLHERHQLSLTRQLLNMIDEKQVQGEAADRLLMALHHENRTRIEQAGKYLRTKDHSRSRL
jgi:DNA primase